jgi:hypothetical protein
MKRKPEAFVRNLAEQAAGHGVTALAADVHLHVVDTLREDEIEVA